MARISVFIWSVPLLLLPACGGEKIDPPQVKGKEISVQINRFEKDLFETAPEAFPAKFKTYSKTYPEFLPRFGQMLNIGKVSDSAFVANLDHFRSDPEVRKVYNECIKEFSSLADIEKDLSQAFTFYRHYFRERKIPQFVSYVSGFNYAIAVGDSFAAVGLDMYMGPSFNYYTLLQFPKFKLPMMRREYIAADLTRAWITTEFENTDKSTELLASIIYQGKILYATDLLLPEIPDSLKWGWNDMQLQWLEENEKRIWAYLVDQKMLFGTNFSENARYINEAPFTPGMPKESPGRAVVWTGLQIVKAYMKKHPSLTLEDLLKEGDSRKILNKSAYKPMN